MIGLGIDLCEIARMARILEEKNGGSFLQRYFTQEEQAYIKGRGNMASQSMAGMFAAKEAFLKALGIGLDGGVGLTCIAVLHQPNGKPYYDITGVAAEKLESLGAKGALLSLTHEGGMAAAVAVIE